MIERDLAQSLRQQASWFPVVSVTGPRQSGKSTLVKSVFPDYTYLNLEDPQLRKAAVDDPVGFIRNRPGHLIIDEAQYAPEVFSMVQVVSDEMGVAGQYVLSGSQNFLLLKNITQSLAGRVGLLKLLPLSFRETAMTMPALDPDAFMLRGGYPRLYATGMPSNVFFNSYIDTYLERDVAGYLDVRNLTSFRTFLKLCAFNVGNLLNVSSLARDAGIDARTAKSWLSMLESSYMIFRLMPYYSNEGKRLVKSPKLYFYDTGLLCHLMGIGDVSQLRLSSHLGAVFENLIVAETAKNHLNCAEDPRLFFYRSDSGIEVDLLDFTNDSTPMAIEVKSGQTYKDAFARHLASVGDALGIDARQRLVVCRVQDSFQAKDAAVMSAGDWLETFSTRPSPNLG